MIFRLYISKISTESQEFKNSFQELFLARSLAHAYLINYDYLIPLKYAVQEHISNIPAILEFT